MSTTDDLRDALVAKYGPQMDTGWDEQALLSDLDALIAAVRQEARARLVEALEGIATRPLTYVAIQDIARAALEAARDTADATPAVERCGAVVHAINAGIPTVTVCSEPRDDASHDIGSLDYDHPFTPQPADGER